MRAFTLVLIVAVAAVGIEGGYRLVTGKELVTWGEPAQEEKAVVSRPAVPKAAPLPTRIPVDPTAKPDSAPDFEPWWVQNHMETELWSGSDNRAISFGKVPQWSHFLVVEPQKGPRLYVLNPRTNDYAYIDAAAVGPGSPPSPNTP